jgi:hypothetical protein
MVVVEQTPGFVRRRQRTGSGEIQLEVELLGLTEGNHIQTGKPLTIRFLWTSEQRVNNVGFGFTIRAADGYAVAGCSNVFENMVADLGPGSGSFDYVIPSFALLPGSYHVAAAIMDRANQHVYDHSPHIAQFDVTSSLGHPGSTGAVELGGYWTGGEGPS